MNSCDRTVVLVVSSWLNFSLRAFAPLREIILPVTLLTVFGYPDVSRAENWERFRGPNGAGQSEDDSIPSEWKAENFLWKRSLESVGHSSPVIWDGTVYVTSADPETGAQLVFAFDAATGNSQWRKKFDLGKYHINARNSYASSTPAVDEEHLYLTWLDGGRVTLVALAHDGNEVWRREVGPYEEVHGYGQSPVVYGDSVYIANNSGAESAVVAFDRHTGEERWRLGREPGITSFAAPCLLDANPDSGRKLLVTSSTASGLAAIDALTGKVAWHGFEEDLTTRCVSSPVVAGGMILAACGEGGNGKMLVAVRPGDGGAPPEAVYKLKQAVPQVPTPLVVGDLLYLWHDRGVVSCRELATGKQIWRERVGGDYYSSPIRLGNRILCCSQAGDAIVLAADTKFELLARNSLNETCIATPAAADRRLFVRTDSTLFCIGASPAR